MRIIQITDLHIGKEGEDTYFVDVRENFRRILLEVEALKPDYLVISGDLCYHQGEKEVYDWIYPQVEALGIPYEVMAGNHDHAATLAQAFGRLDEYSPDGLYFKRQWQDQVVLFMDSSPHQVFEPQLNWLKSQLDQLNSDLILFIHHPPMLVGTPFMDLNHSLRNRDPLLAILNAYPHPVSIFCGHYHVERTVRWKNLSIHLTPSCFFQINSYTEEFQVDHYQIALREINLHDGHLSSRVSYFSGHLLG
jgi:3',5'-cyclic-AMP phosphodiesterase